MADLIDRAAVLALTRYVVDELEADDPRKTGWIKADAIAALPAQGMPLAEAASVILTAMGRAQIDMTILRKFFNGEPRAALTDLAALAPASGGVDAHPYSLRPDLQRIVDNAKTAPQWDTEHDRLAPAPVDALVKALTWIEEHAAVSDRNNIQRVAHDAIAALPAQGVRVKPLTDEDREWIDTRADELFREHERSKGAISLNTVGPKDYRDYFVASATAERLAALAPAEAGGVKARDAAIAKMVKVAATQLWGEGAAERVTYSVRYGDDAPTSLHYMHPGYNKPYPISTVLRDLAAQEGCDGEPYDAMVFAADVIDRLSLAPAEAGGVEEPISDARLECEALCARFLAGEASEKEVVDTIRRIARSNERLAVLASKHKEQMRPETDMEHIARDMREGRFPERSEPQMVPVTPAPVDALVKAAEALHADMLERARTGIDAIHGEEYRIVNAGRTAWHDFDAALAAYRGAK